MKKRTLILILLLIINWGKTFSQKRDYFIFQARDINFIDTITLSDFYKGFSFCSFREYHQDSSFTDLQIICSSNHEDCSLTFKKYKRNWYIKTENKWKLFYSGKSNNLQSINKFNNDFRIIPLKTRTCKSKIMFGFEIKMNKYVESEKTIYWFNPEYGIIAIENSQLVLVRSDVIPVITPTERTATEVSK